MLDPVVEQKMDVIAEGIFGTKSDPEQIPITEDAGKKLETLTPHWIEYELDEKGDPIAWVITLPTTRELAQKFLKREINERQLLEFSTPQEQYEALYLCAAVTVPEHRRRGLAHKLFLRAIIGIPKTPNHFIFAWPTGAGGREVAEKVAQTLGRELRFRE